MKNFVIAILAIAVIALAVLHFTSTPAPLPLPPVGTTNVVEKVVNGSIVVTTNVVVEVPITKDGKTEIVPEEAPLTRSVERRPLEPEATKRLHDGPVLITSLLEASGKAEHASGGKSIRGSYLYTTTVQAFSEVVSKDEDGDTGRICVVEERTFRSARDSIALSDIDAAIALETLPVEEVKQWVDCGCALVSGLCDSLVANGVAVEYAAVGSAGARIVSQVATAAFAFLHMIDGKSARGMLGEFGVQIPSNLEEFANQKMSEYANKQLGSIHTALQSIEGKTYVITYSQAADGKPLNVDFKHKDGDPITKAEWEILRNANAFLDSDMVPDSRCRVGDAWTVWADEAQELFGAAGDGRAEGNIRVSRMDDQPDGSWTLQIEPSEITYKTSDGTAAGTMLVKGGNGLADAESASVKSLQATAEGNLRSLSRERHALFFNFVKRIEGDSNLRFTLTVEPGQK